jgi:ABC-type Fe3+/spermidine/putrescine transport system ATPase subunit
VGAVLTVTGVRHRRAGRVVLSVDRLEVAAHERLGVLGANGAGKTTLLRLLAALDAPSAGDVTIDGVGTRAGGVALRRRIAYVPQQPVLLSTSVRRNVELPLRYRSVPQAQRRARALDALRALGVEHLADRRAQALSRGEAQRVCLARALATSPEVLLLDEPAASLDGPARTRFLSDLDRTVTARSAPVVHVSHRSEELLGASHRLVVLAGGEVRQCGPPADVAGRPADAHVAELVGYENVIAAVVAADRAILVAGAPTGLDAPAAAAPGDEVTIAAWATGVRVREADGTPLSATVVSLRPGAGRWEARLALPAGLEVRAQLPLDEPPPAPGDRVAVGFDPALAAVIAPHPERVTTTARPPLAGSRRSAGSRG